MERHYDSLQALAADFGQRMAGYVGKMRRTLLDEATTFMDVHSRREPVLTGALRASRVVLRGGEENVIGWTAPYATVINLGRKRSKPYVRRIRGIGEAPRGKRGKLLGAAGTKPFTRMLGSKQARGGMTRPAFRALRRDWGKVIEKAVERTEGGS